MLKSFSAQTNALGALNYKGTWDATANSPALASSVGTKGDYYVVSVAGSTTLDGISNWGIGDWAVFNGSVWQRVEGGADLNGVNLTVSNNATIGGVFSFSSDVNLNRDAADILAQRRGTTAQAFRVYNTYTDASNFERVQLYTSGTSGGVGWTQAGSGLARNFLVSGNQLVFQSGSSYLNRWIISSSGHFVAADDNTYDIGASGATRPRNLYMGSWIRMAVVTVATLPAAATAGAGARMMVNDALAPVFGNAVAGGGAVTVPVYSTGAAWNVG